MHLLRVSLLCAVIAFTTGCAQLFPKKASFDPKMAASLTAQWTGRMALRIEDQPSQSFSANFELEGTPAQGNLKLFSPLGNVLVELEWSPLGATLSASGRRDKYESLQVLVSQAHGSPLPVEALFDWLNGRQTLQTDWTVNLDQYPNGRVTAMRALPATELRIIFDLP